MKILRQWFKRRLPPADISPGRDPLADLETAMAAAVGAWDGQHKPPEGYLRAYAGAENQRILLAHYRLSVAEKVEGFTGSTGVDMGCWYGFSTLALAALGCRRVYGVELNATFAAVARAWRPAQPLRNIEFLHAADHVVPLASGSVDWVVINQVLCNALPGSFTGTLAETARLLRSGGLLIFSDSNNPHCPAVVERLTRTYRTVEIGNGTTEKPAGSNHREREKVIEQYGPALNPVERSALARGSCYHWGSGLEEIVERYRRTGEMPADVFEDGIQRTPCNPRTGAALGNVTDPFVIEAGLRELGFDTRVTIAPGRIPADHAECLAALRESQGFYIYAQRR